MSQCSRTDQNTSREWQSRAVRATALFCFLQSIYKRAQPPFEGRLPNHPGGALHRSQSGANRPAEASNQNAHRHSDIGLQTDDHDGERTALGICPVSAACAACCTASQAWSGELLSRAVCTGVLVGGDRFVRAADVIASRLATMPPISSQTSGANHTLGTRFGGQLATHCGRSFRSVALGAVAPYLPFAIPVGNRGNGWISEL